MFQHLEELLRGQGDERQGVVEAERVRDVELRDLAFLLADIRVA